MLFLSPLFLIKKHNVHWLLLLLFSCFVHNVALAQYESAPAAYYLHQGHINTLNFQENNSVKMKGSWQFYERQLLTQKTADASTRWVDFPESFQTLTGHNQTYGTFIGTFKIPKEFLNRRIAILVPNQPSAYRIYLNGDLLLRLGELDIDPKKQITEKASRIAYFVPESEYFSLAIQASSVNSLHGGFEAPMKIGVAKTINRQFQLHMMSIALVCGAVLGVGLSTILFAIFKGSEERNRKRVFVFGIFIIFLALHNLFSAPHAYTVFSSINWLWGTRLEYLFTFAALIFFLTYMYWLNPRYLHRWVFCIAIGFLLLNTVVVLATAPDIFEPFALVSALFSIVVLANFIAGFYQTVRQHEYYSVVNLGAVIFLCITFTHDMLLMFNLIDSINLSFISTSLYALLIMLQQSRNYAHHTYHTEQLNQQLLELNNSLDHKVKQRTAELDLLNQQLERQAKIDALTGAYNRRALNDELSQRFTQNTVPLYFAMLDVDYFKNYNDHYGHLKGDEVLKNLVALLQQALPENAYVARYGGEEFAIILQDLPLHHALELFEDVLSEVRAAQIPHENRADHLAYVTLSMGIACMQEHNEFADIHALMKAADVQLYAAKAAGRNQFQI